MKQILMIKELKVERDYKLHQVKSVFFVAKTFFLSVAISMFGLGIILLFL